MLFTPEYSIKMSMPQTIMTAIIGILTVLLILAVIDVLIMLVSKIIRVIEGKEKSEADDEAPVSEKAEAKETSTAVNVTASGAKVTAPMPGTLLSVDCSVGQAVKAGETLMILEAMKMENEIVAPCDGVIGQLLVSKGSKVNTDDVLAVI